MPGLRHDAASRTTEPATTVPSSGVIRDPRGRFVAGSAKPARRRRGGVVGNMNAVANPWASYWRRRALKPEHRWALRLVEDYVPSVVADLGGEDAVSFAQRKVAEVAAVARVCWALAMTSGNLDAVARFITVETRALESIGLERRAKPVPSLAEILAGEHEDDQETPGGANGDETKGDTESNTNAPHADTGAATEGEAA